MFHRLPQLLTALSLLLCIAAVMLWVRSHGGGERFGWRVAGAKKAGVVEAEYAVRSAAGKFQALSYRNEVNAASAIQAIIKRQAPVQPARPGLFWESLPAAKDEAPREGAVATAEKEPASFRFYNDVNGTARTRGVLVPYWFLFVWTALLPAHAAYRMARRRGETDDEGRGSGESVPFTAWLSQAVSSVFLIVACLLACVWVRSWYVGDRISWGDSADGRGRFVDIHSGKGELVLHTRRVDGKAPRHATLPGRDAASVSDGLRWRSDSDATVGYTTETFALARDSKVGAEGSVSALTFAAPFWALVLVNLLPPLWWLRRLERAPVHVMTIGGGIDRGGNLMYTGGAPANGVNQRPL